MPDQSREVLAPSAWQRTTSRTKAVLVGLVLAISIGSADASDQTVILGFICDTYESARRVALEQSWKSPEGMPGDCECLFGQDLERRFAEIIEIVEVLPIEDDRWIEIGKVRRNVVETGYSAGIESSLLLL